MSNSDLLLLRPHHGMCMVYFKGRGYSSAFSLHMAETIDFLRRENPLLKLVLDWDEVCSVCPNQASGSCHASGNALRYDRAVLEHCAFQEGEIVRASDFFERVERCILTAGRREQICGSCQWNALCTGAPVRLHQSDCTQN